MLSPKNVKTTEVVTSVHTVCRLDEGFRKQYKHRCHRMKKGVAKVAAARKLAVRLFWMLRTNTALSGDRSHREQPARWCGRRKLDREIDWALSHPDRPVQKTALTRLGKQKVVFLPHRSGGWMFASNIMVEVMAA
jgi:hypothetical protein